MQPFFYLRLVGQVSKVTDETVVLHGAQGTVIPVEDMRDIEIQPLDQHGRLITIQERVAGEFTNPSTN